jgi:hypothetical protein
MSWVKMITTEQVTDFIAAALSAILDNKTGGLLWNKLIIERNAPLATFRKPKSAPYMPGLLGRIIDHRVYPPGISPFGGMFQVKEIESFIESLRADTRLERHLATYSRLSLLSSATSADRRVIPDARYIAYRLMYSYVALAPDAAYDHSIAQSLADQFIASLAASEVSYLYTAIAYGVHGNADRIALPNGVILRRLPDDELCYWWQYGWDHLHVISRFWRGGAVRDLYVLQIPLNFSDEVKSLLIAAANAFTDILTALRIMKSQRVTLRGTFFTPLSWPVELVVDCDDSLFI